MRAQKGQVARSQEVVTAVSLFAVVGVVWGHVDADERTPDRVHGSSGEAGVRRFREGGDGGDHS